MAISTVFALWGIGGYLLGSIPFGLVLCFLAGYGDIRKIGSGNIGATNVLRTGSKSLALLTILLDASKAGIAAFAAYKLVAPEPYVFCGFMTTTNVMASLIAGTMATNPLLALLALLTWLVMAFTFKYSSLSAITAAVLVPVYAFFLVEPVYAVFYSAIALLVLVRHHANIRRLIKGEESKIKLKKS